MMMVNDQKVLLPIHTDCVLLFRKCRILLRRDAQGPSFMPLVTSLETMMALNMEL